VIDLPDCNVTETHARGLRRAEDRWVNQRLAHWRPHHKPRRFGPRVRQLHEQFMAIYGEGRLRREFDGKKSVLWFCIEHESDGRYRVAVRSLDRRPGRSQLSSGRIPIEATSHSYERFIQAMVRFESDWISTLLDIFKVICDTPGYDRDMQVSDAGRFVWRSHGFTKVWIKSGLAFVEIPERGAAIVRTLVDADALIGPNRVLWKTLGKSETKLQFVDRDAFEYRDPFTAQSWLEPTGGPG
jgi:hypothetical protein